MSSTRLDRLRKLYPEEEPTISRLEVFIDQAQDGMSFTLDRVYDLTKADSYAGLGILMGELVQEGYVKRTFLIESPSNHVKLGEFETFAEIPEIVHDTSINMDIPVNSESLSVRFHKAS